jgi:hypothetical protein
VSEDGKQPAASFNMLEWALNYAARGLYIMPLHEPVDGGCTCQRGKDCPTPGKHPRLRAWEAEASRDPETIRAWWRQWPSANIGLAVGRSDLYVVDVDTRKGGGQAWNRIAETNGRELLDTCRHVTGGVDDQGNPGMHFIFQMPTPRRHNTASIIAEGIDTRGDGGMIVLPPSLHQSGRRYAVVSGRDLWTSAPKPLPPFLIALEEASKNRIAPGGAPEGADMGEIPRGRRDSTLLRIAGAMRRRGLGQDEILAALRVTNQKRCKPPVSEEKLVELARRAGRYPAADPAVLNEPEADTGAKRGYWCPNCWEDGLDQKLPTKWVCSECHKPVVYPTWWAKKGPEGDFIDTGFSTGTLSHVNGVLRKSKDQQKALDQAMRDKLIPKELREKLLEALRAYRENKPITIDSRLSIEAREDAWYMVIDGKDRNERRVFARPCEVLKVVRIEDQRLAVMEMNGGVFAGDYDEVLTRLTKNYQVLDKRSANDVLAHLVHHCENQTTGYATFEVISDQGRLFLPDEIYPRDDVQAELMKELDPHLETTPAPDGWRDWAGLFAKLNPYEVAPAMGLAAIAPFAPILRRYRLMIPYVLHLSKNPGKGKSLIANAVTHHLWRNKFELAEAIDKPYRLAAFGNSGAVPKGVDEAQTLNWEALSGFFKQMAESEDGTSRGTKDLGMKNYKPRASFIFTSNALPGLSQPVVARFLIVHYDEQRVFSEPFLRDLEFFMNRLPVAGPALARAGIELAGGREGELLRKIREDIRPELQKRFNKWVETGRRPTAWAAIYLGLMIWEKASGGIVRCPSIDEFVDQVIVPVEASTKEAVMDPLTAFISWLIRYVAKNQNGDGRVRGNELIFRFHEEFGRKGYLVTQAMLEEYNSSVKDRPEAQISGLSELANLVSSRFLIPLSEIRGDDGKLGKVYKFTGTNRRAVFVPDDEVDGTIQTSLNGNGHETNGNGLGQMDRIRRMVAILRATSRLAPDGVPMDVLEAQVAAAGLPLDHVSRDIEVLKERGEVYFPRHGTVLPV